MKRSTCKIGTIDVPIISTKVAVVGTGAASLNAALRLNGLGVEDVIVVTEKIGAGTSANAGSDKQTYYRLNPAVSDSDSIRDMARDLFSGSCMHGDIALVEAALSQRSFFHLVEAGVPFPQNRYGEHVGFQTDHDTKGRGTSAGPKTSMLMVEMLLKRLGNSNVPILNDCTVIELLTVTVDKQTAIAGMIVLEKGHPLVIKSEFVVFGTGGPGALYYDSAYPRSQFGSLGIAMKAGVKAQNLTESQFGIAAVKLRWNLSGSYQQVLPAYISTKKDGSEPCEFLKTSFPSQEALLDAQFLKGYQWPFDVRKLSHWGSSLIDLLVYNETVLKKRKVFLDFRRNPFEGDFDPKRCPPVVRQYLEKSHAMAASPVERLRKMNFPAYELFREHGLDLEQQPLEIAICHQHCNGGLAGSIWWESSLAGFFPVGECNGTHGIYRPGGSALNSGQCGSLRAAEMINYRLRKDGGRSWEQFNDALKSTISSKLEYLASLTSRKKFIDPLVEREVIQKRMSSTLGIVRDSTSIKAALVENKAMQLEHEEAGVRTWNEITAFLKNEDLLITEQACLESANLLATFLKTGRGSYLCGDTGTWLKKLAADRQSPPGLPDHSLDHRIIQLQMDSTGRPKTWFEDVRPIPEPENWFERVWKDYREASHFNH